MSFVFHTVMTEVTQKGDIKKVVGGECGVINICVTYLGVGRGDGARKIYGMISGR